MESLQTYEVAIEPTWIDYNGHVRDAYYGVAFSLAIDDVMDQLGLDAEYRARTRGTLYTLEMHCHFLHEVKQSDALRVRSVVLESDAKRILLAGVFERGADRTVAAIVEAMLLHVVQGETTKSAPLPAAVAERVGRLRQSGEWRADWPRSRTLALRPG
jgi:acyl-CoA thioester hydrolase